MLPNKYYEYNKTIAIRGKLLFPDNPLVKQFDYPNGRYRIDTVGFTEDNPRIFQFGGIIEVQNGLNQDKM
jgi:hypothetical protein